MTECARLLSLAVYKYSPKSFVGKKWVIDVAFFIRGFQ